MLEIVLASSLIATVITVIFQYITNKKSDNLKYITNERIKWRQELRNIAEDIQSADQQNIKKFLVKLKMRINAYGNYSPHDYDRDGHLWINMNMIENEIDTEKFELHKEVLINFISLLLKKDWEKSKKEVNGNIIDALLIVVYVGFVSFLIYFHFFVCQLGFGVEALDMILVVGLNTCWWHKVIYSKLRKKDYEKYLKDKKDCRDFGLNEKEMYKILLKSIIGYLGIRIIPTIMIGYSYFSKINMRSYEVYIYIIIIFTLIAIMLEMIKALSMYNDFREYFHSIVLEINYYNQKCSILDKNNTKRKNKNQFK